jgi:hypothetical protein
MTYMSPSSAGLDPFSRSFGFSRTTVVPGGTLSVSQTLDPIIDERPTVVRPPRMVALA